MALIQFGFKEGALHCNAPSILNHQHHRFNQIKIICSNLFLFFFLKPVPVFSIFGIKHKREDLCNKFDSQILVWRRLCEVLLRIIE
jgi:hypothetical protein